MIRARALVWAAVLAIVAVGAVAAATRAAPSTVGSAFTDENGRIVVANGLNTASSSKAAPDGHPDLTEGDLDRESADMGTSVVRYLISWRMVEPEPGVYDDGYLDEVAERVQWYAERGYRVMLDMHQDLWGMGITPDGTTGNGAPDWATAMDGLPVGEHDMWELYYLEPGVIRAFDNFWNTTGQHPELMEHYAGAWRAVAERFADVDAVLAYDLMNEPFGGTLQGAEFEPGPLTELYQLTVDAIREVDDETWACLEPQAMAVNWGLPSGLGHVNDPRGGPPRIAYCPHLYPLSLDFGDGFVDAGRDMVEATVSAWTANVLRTADALGDVPVIVGEYGLDTTQPGAIDYVAFVHQTMDAAGIGTVYWSSDDGAWGPYESDGTKRNLVDVLDRPYPRVVDADALTWESEPDALTLHVEGPGSGHSEAYLPGAAFADGVRLSGARELSWDPATRRIVFAVEQGARIVEFTGER